MKTITSQIPLSSCFFIVALMVYAFAAKRISGYNHPDEHFQIIEFAQFKLGKVALNQLAWEYNAKIRSGVQPALCYLIFRTANFMGVESPYELSFILRLITAILSVCAISFFVKSSKHLIRSNLRNAFTLASYFLWFLPYINVRYSSETWSGILLLFCTSLIFREDFSKSTRNACLLGFFLGMAILFRFQSGIFVTGILSWMFLIKKISIKKISMIIAFIIFALFIGVLIDLWLYGSWTIALYSYFRVNLIEGVSSQYGTSPWYEIPNYILFSPGPIGIFICITFIIVIFTQSKNMVLWGLIPFLIIHTVIPHKELRFLYPIVNFIPLILFLGYQTVLDYSFFTKPIFSNLAIVVLVLTNIPGLLASMSRGAGDSKVAVTEFLNEKYHNKQINLISREGLNPFNPWEYPKDSFYTSKNVMRTEIRNIWIDGALLPKVGYINILLISDEDFTGSKTTELLKKANAHLVYRNISRISTWINELYNPELNNDILMLYEIKD